MQLVVLFNKYFLRSNRANNSKLIVNNMLEKSARRRNNNSKLNFYAIQNSIKSNQEKIKDTPRIKHRTFSVAFFVPEPTSIVCNQTH